MTTTAGWYDDKGRQMVEATTSSARACFYLGSAIGLLTGLAALPTTALPSSVLKPQWDVRAVLTKPFPSAVRLYGEGWQFEVVADPSQAASLSGSVDGVPFTITLDALPAPQPQLLSWSVVDTMLFRSSPVQRLSVNVNGAYPAGGIELPRELKDADYYDTEDITSAYRWEVWENTLHAIRKDSGTEVAAGTNIVDSFILFISGHIY